MKVRVKELWVGDRFRAHRALWTYLGRDHEGQATARKHSQDSIKQKEAGFGYRLDTICSFPLSQAVEFVPVAAGFIDGSGK